MSRQSRTRTLLAYLLAVPVIVLAYVSFVSARVWAALRPSVATLLGATVISTVYADEALKRAPATPMRAAAVLALAVVLVGPGMAPAPASAAGSGPEAVIAAAKDYLGHRYQMGAEGPKYFDCSGLVYRVFADTGELPRISGMRLLARGYLRWFTSRGLFTKSEDKAQPGDLVVWNDGEHIGIYLGDGKALSALINPYGVSVHSLTGIHQKVTQFLTVDWGSGDGGGGTVDPGDGTGGGGGGGDNGGDNTGSDNTVNTGGEQGGKDQASDNDGTGAQPASKPDARPDANVPDSTSARGNGDSTGSARDRSAPDSATDNSSNGQNQPTTQPVAADLRAGGYATGTLNMRDSADPNGRIVGWVSRGDTFKIVARSNSPSGWLWYQVRLPSGKEGWLFSYWVREL
jgi:cell wall-associated NlpC family hydrolase